MKEPLKKKEILLEKLGDFLQWIVDFLSVTVELLVQGVWWVVSKTFLFIWHFIKAVLKNVYGRMVVALGGLIYLYLASGAHAFLDQLINNL